MTLPNKIPERGAARKGAVPARPRTEAQNAQAQARAEASRTGLFNVDYRLPDEWSQQVRRETALMRQYQQNGPLVQQELDERGLPVSWDYRSAPAGPWGEPLPDGAAGWTPLGEPDWGGGLAGHMKKLYFNFWKDRARDENIPSLNERLSQLRSGIQASANQAMEESGGGLSAWESFKVITGSLAQGAGTLLQLIGDGWQQAEGDKLNWFSGIPRFAGAVLDTAAFAFQESDRYVEENIVGPSIYAVQEVATVDKETVDKWRNWVGPLGLFPMWANVGVGLITGKIGREELHRAEQDEKNRI